VEELVLGFAAREDAVAFALERVDEEVGIFRVRDGGYLDDEGAGWGFGGGWSVSGGRSYAFDGRGRIGCVGFSRRRSCARGCGFGGSG
jgi:hypothetical protein